MAMGIGFFERGGGVAMYFRNNIVAKIVDRSMGSSLVDYLFRLLLMA